MTNVVLPEKLETDRLILRQWRDQDIAPFSDLNADPIVMEHFPKVATRAETEAYVAKFRRHFDQNKFGLWATEIKESGQFIGFIGLQIPPFEASFMPAVEIGWRLAKEHWGKGYAPEGACEILRDSFERIGLKEVISMTATTNLKSMRVMEKIGMTRDPAEDFDHPMIAKGDRLQRHVLYRISVEDWAARKS